MLQCVSRYRPLYGSVIRLMELRFREGSHAGYDSALWRRFLAFNARVEETPMGSDGVPALFLHHAKIQVFCSTNSLVERFLV